MGRQKKIVTLGGGSGQCALLSGLRDLEDFQIKAVVTMMDSGGSTGRLRDELGVLPPGDLLKCLIALSPYRKMAAKMLQKRFTGQHRLQGHNAGNMFLTLLSQYVGNFPQAISALGEVLDIRGEVLPVTTSKASLVARLSDGSRLYGEAAIDVPKGGRRPKIVEAFLVPHHGDSISAYPPVIRAIESADYLILGPGDLFTSLVPNLLVSGVGQAISKSRGKLIYIVNLMTKNGETDGFSGSDFVTALEEFLHRQMDWVVFNSKNPPPKMLKIYADYQAEPVVFNKTFPWGTRKIIRRKLLEVHNGSLRHNSKRLARAMEYIISQ